MDKNIDKNQAIRERIKQKKLLEFKKKLEEIRKNNKYYLSILAIIKNEAPYIKEWLDYHISMGVEHFYLYNNESEDNLEEVLQPYIDNNIVSHTPWPGKAQQRIAYADMMIKHYNETRWLAVIDIDEFICPVEKISIPDFMRGYEDYVGLIINWVSFDSNGHKHKPEGGVLENFTRTHKEHKSSWMATQIKSIADPLWIESIGIHGHIYKLNQLPVNEHFEPVEEVNFLEKFSIDKVRINHYITKSVEEYLAKIERGRASVDSKNTLSESVYNFPEETKHDYTIFKHIGKNIPKCLN